MKYVYHPRSVPDLQQIADRLRQRFAHRVQGYSLDIEGIIEDLGISVIPRPMTGFDVEAYCAKDPRFIVINEGRLIYIPRARFTLCEEVCHRILEFDLWKNGKLPDGSMVHELSEAQYREIEKDACQLTAELLQPEPVFRERFAHHVSVLQTEGLQGDLLIRSVIKAIAQNFKISISSTALRAKHLKLISSADYERLYYPLL